MHPKISVIVPVYKAEKYLRRCVDSILAQTFTDFELLLIDDGSPDNSGAICDEYAQKDARIKVIHKGNGGSNSARKEGFIHSRGKYLVFLDSDDTLTDGALGILYNNIIKGYDIVKGCVAKTNQKDEIISTEHYRFSEGEIESEEEITKRIFNGDIAPYLCGSIYRRDLFTTEIFEKSIEVNISFGEDWITNLLIAKKVNKLLCIKDVVYNYYINTSSMTSTQVISLEYYERQNEVLRKESIYNELYIKDAIEGRICYIYIRSFFTPELGFNLRNYKKVKNTFTDGGKEIKKIIEQKTDCKFLYFINCLPLYFLYSRLYCLLFYIIKLHCNSRKILR